MGATPTLPAALQAIDAAIAQIQTFTGARAAVFTALISADDSVRAAAYELRKVAEESQDALDALNETRKALQALQPTRTSFASLPLDVLVELFKTWASMDEPSRNHRSRLIPPAFAAASVSKQWRSVALGTPSIWSSVVINSHYFNNESYAELMLSRSKGHLFRRLSLKNVPSDHVLPLPSNQLASLLSHTEAVEVAWSTEFYQMDADYTSTILPIFQSYMPALKSLIFSSPPDMTCPIVPDGVKLLTLAPNLEHLHLEDIGFCIEVNTLPLLRFFGAASPLNEAQLRALSTCPKLVHLDAYADDEPQGDAIQFPHLQTLNTSSNLMKLIGDPSSVPNLHTLGIAGDSLPLREFLQHSICTSLKTLNLLSTELYNTTLGMQHLLTTIFPSLPNLTTLGLHNATELSSFFRDWSQRTDIIFPSNLTALHIVQSSMSTQSVQALVSFLQQRNAAEPISGAQSSYSRVEELRITQEGALAPSWFIFSPWMLPRLQQLVPRVIVNTESALISEGHETEQW